MFFLLFPSESVFVSICILCSHPCPTMCRSSSEEEILYFIMSRSPIQEIQIIQAESMDADGHCRVCICNLTPFKCILEKKKDNLAYWTHSPWRANCNSNEHHTLRELQCPLSCCSEGWEKIWQTHFHRYTQRKEEEEEEVEEEKKRANVHFKTSQSCKQSLWSR